MRLNSPEKITDRQWLNLFRTQWENHGYVGEWVFASRKEKPQIGVAVPEPDAVVIVPIHVEDKQRRLVVVREFRVPVADYEFGFPAGLKNHNESIAECAARELREETGLQLTVIKRVSPVVYSSSGLSDESVVMVFCECVGEVSGESREAVEEMDIHLLDIEQVKQLCTNYNVKQSSKMWPVLYMFSLTGQL